MWAGATTGRPARGLPLLRPPARPPPGTPAQASPGPSALQAPAVRPQAPAGPFACLSSTRRACASPGLETPLRLPLVAGWSSWALAGPASRAKPPPPPHPTPGLLAPHLPPCELCGWASFHRAPVRPVRSWPAPGPSHPRPAWSSWGREWVEDLRRRGPLQASALPANRPLVCCLKIVA